jgi:hypothetical protein
MVVRMADGYAIHTARMGLIVGPRLDRRQGVCPVCKTSGLDIETAKKAFTMWETFCAQQDTKKKKK